MPSAQSELVLGPSSVSLLNASSFAGLRSRSTSRPGSSRTFGGGSVRQTHVPPSGYSELSLLIRSAFFVYFNSQPWVDPLSSQFQPEEESEDKHSSSIIDLIASCQSATDFILKLDWPNKYENARYLTGLSQVRTISHRVILGRAQY